MFDFLFIASGATIDATQELFTLSLCNTIGSFFSSMPVTGSFSRSAVNHASGVQTPLGGVITGKFLLLTILYNIETPTVFAPMISLHKVTKYFYSSSKNNKDICMDCSRGTPIVIEFIS